MFVSPKYFRLPNPCLPSRVSPIAVGCSRDPRCGPERLTRVARGSHRAPPETESNVIGSAPPWGSALPTSPDAHGSRRPGPSARKGDEGRGSLQKDWGARERRGPWKGVCTAGFDAESLG